MDCNAAHRQDRRDDDRWDYGGDATQDVVRGGETERADVYAVVLKRLVGAGPAEVVQQGRNRYRL